MHCFVAGLPPHESSIARTSEVVTRSRVQAIARRSSPHRAPTQARALATASSSSSRLELRAGGGGCLDTERGKHYRHTAAARLWLWRQHGSPHGWRPARARPSAGGTSTAVSARGRRAWNIPPRAAKLFDPFRWPTEPRASRSPAPDGPALLRVPRPGFFTRWHRWRRPCPARSDRRSGHPKRCPWWQARPG